MYLGLTVWIALNVLFSLNDYTKTWKKWGKGWEWANIYRMLSSVSLFSAYYVYSLKYQLSFLLFFKSNIGNFFLFRAKEGLF